jgi:hypothetical protein
MTQTPHAHAVSRGYYRPHDPLVPQNEAHYHWRHAIADQLHGWSQDAYNYQAAGEAFELSSDDYEYALLAAAEYPNTPAHAPAVPNRSTQPSEVTAEGEY